MSAIASTAAAAPGTCGAPQATSGPEGIGQAAAAGGFERLLLASSAAFDIASDAAPLPEEAMPEATEALDDADDWPPAGLFGLGWSPETPQAPVPLTPQEAAAAVPDPAPDPDADADALALLPDGRRAAPPAAANGSHPSTAAAQAADAQAMQAAGEEALAAASPAAARRGADMATAGMESTASAPIALHGVGSPSFSALFAPLSSPQPTTAPADAAHATPDLHGDDFADDFGARLHWMADQKIGHARIRINPQELGPVEVRLRLDGDRVSADFISAQPEVRQALEQSLPRLGELLGQHGFQLAHADVGQQRQDGGTPDGEAGNAEPRAGAAAGEDDAVPAGRLRHANGLLDAYA